MGNDGARMGVDEGPTGPALGAAVAVLVGVGTAVRAAARGDEATAGGAGWAAGAGSRPDQPTHTNATSTTTTPTTATRADPLPPMRVVGGSATGPGGSSGRCITETISCRRRCARRSGAPHRQRAGRRARRRGG